MPSEITASMSSKSSWGNATPRPDWVILGAPNSDGSFSVFASKTLSKAELESKANVAWVTEYPNSNYWATPYSLGSTITLTVVMGDMSIITGPDYATCLRALLDDWKPETSQTPTLEAGAR